MLECIEMFFSRYYNRDYSNLEISENQSKAKWISPRKKITIGEKTITGGLFYFGGVLIDDYGRTESSLVDDGLSIKNSSYTFTDYSLEYWPSFQSLSPKCRGAYIDWLASDRDMPDTPIGYLFLYFYGLERRITMDYKGGLISNQKCAEICKEILRLKSIFKKNYSFNGYSSRLLSYISIVHPSVFCLSDDEIEGSTHLDILKVKLARVAKNKKPLNSNLAYAWIRKHPDYNFRTPSRRCPEEFKALFTQKYKENYHDGIIIKPSRTKLQLFYKPANGSMDYFKFGPSDLYDTTVLSAPVKKLAAIATQCTDELDTYSRYLGKKNTHKEDIDAIALLPKDIINEFGTPLVKDFRLLFKNIIKNKDGICDFKDFWLHTKCPLPKKVNKKERELICNLAENLGYSLAPHPVLHGSKFNLDDPIVIYERDFSAKLENSTVFDSIAIKLRLGTIIANADLKIHSNEVFFLQNIIHSNDNLTPQEKLSLEAYLKWLLNTSSNFNGPKSSLAKLRNKDKEVVRKMLIDVALSDGKIHPNEVKEIEKLYTALGLDKSTVPADIHALSSGKKGHINKTSSVSVASGEKRPFKIDENVLSAHEAETKEAQSILKKVFKDEDEIESEESLEVPTESTLENKALDIYRAISDKDKIEISEFERICSEYDFFVDAAIDAINEWSFDKVSAPVIESDTDIIINREIANELKELEDT